MNTMKWLLKREFWEHRGGFFWAPVIVGIVFLVLNIAAIVATLAAAGRNHIQIGLIKFDTIVRNLGPKDMELAGAGVDMTLYMVSGILGFVVGIVVFFYCLGALYDERRDRSVLFWKSLPLSDSATVVSKVLSATVIAPVIGVIAGILTGIGVLLIVAIFFAFHGQNVLGLLFSGNPFAVLVTLLASIPVAALWALPAVGWLMLCSAWARSKPFLWAVFIPVGVGLMVSWFDLMQSLTTLPDTWFWENVVFRVLFSVFPFSWLGSSYITKLESMDNEQEMMLNLFGISDVLAPLAGAEIWIGAVAGIAMLFAAVRLRRWRDDG